MLTVGVTVLNRYVGLPRQRPDAEEIPVCHDEEWSRERRSEEEVEVAANPTEQGGQESVHFSTAPPKYITSFSTNDTQDQNELLRLIR